MGKVSAMGQPTRPTHPSRVGKFVVNHVITWIAEVGTINTADQGRVWLLAAGQGPWACAKPTAYRLYTRSVYVMNNVLEMVSG